MKRLDARWATLITFVVMLLGWWYWYEYRPQKIREECAQLAINGNVFSTGDIAKLDRWGGIVLRYCEAAGGVDAWTIAIKKGKAAAEKLTRCEDENFFGNGGEKKCKVGENLQLHLETLKVP
jgi:hypothetical protein